LCIRAEPTSARARSILWERSRVGGQHEWALHSGAEAVAARNQLKEGGIIKEHVKVCSIDFDGSYEMFMGDVHDYDQSAFKIEADAYFMKPDAPLPKHFKRLQKLHQKQRKRQLARAHKIADVFFAAPTHY
jgi:hypothetical protein